MGLFQKAKSEEKSEEKSKDELPQYVDSLLEDSHQTTNEEIDERFSVESMSLNSNYGIDHVVALMRDLPNDNKEIVVFVVTKTLESANINIYNIIRDAAKKERLLETEIHQLKDEIKKLQEQISEKEEKISVSSAILTETIKVKGMLENSDLNCKQKTTTINPSTTKDIVDQEMEVAPELAAEAQ